MSTEAASAVQTNRGLRDRVLILRSMAPLAPLDFDGLFLIAEHVRPRQWRKGEVIYREGEAIDEVQIVVNGRIRVNRKGKHVVDVERGGGAGFLTTLARDPDGVEAIALEPTSSLGLPVEVLFDSFEQNFSLLRNAIRLSATTVLETRGGLPTGERTDSADPGKPIERSPTFVERLIEIRANEIFGRSNVEAAVEYVRGSREVRGHAGDVLFEIGERSDHWLEIAHGRMRCTTADGESTTVGAGTIVGIFDGFAMVPRPYRVVSETDYHCYRIPKETIFGIFEAHFNLGVQTLTFLSNLVLSAGESQPTLNEGGETAAIDGD